MIAERGATDSKLVGDLAGTIPKWKIVAMVAEVANKIGRQRSRRILKLCGTRALNFFGYSNLPGKASRTLVISRCLQNELTSVLKPRLVNHEHVILFISLPIGSLFKMRIMKSY